MATRSNSSVFLFSVYIIFQFWSAYCSTPSVPTALYVFGDSLSENGNSNFLQTQAKANYKPYGIDFPSGVTGRFTNGKTYADFIVQSMGLPLVPPYLGHSAIAKGKTTLGVNYASGSAGILPETGRKIRLNLGLEAQIKLFQETVTKDFPKKFKTQAELSQYLGKSIFIVSIGINNYLQPAQYNSSKKYDPQQFAALLAADLKQHLKYLHNLGARKFVVFGLAPIGCSPAIVNMINPRPKTPCAENVNKLVTLYNIELSIMLRELKSTLPRSVLVHGDTYKTIYDMILNPNKYGLSTGRSPCCAHGRSGTCIPNAVPCQDMTKHVYWDAFHPTEAFHGIVGHGCFVVPLYVFPSTSNNLYKSNTNSVDSCFSVNQIPFIFRNLL